MVKIYLTGSRQFYVEIESIKEYFTEQGFEVYTSGKGENAYDSESEQTSLIKAFENINFCDHVYVYAKKGYVGKSVISEISYAFAKKKSIISSEMLSEPITQIMTSQVIRPEELWNALGK